MVIFKVLLLLSISSIVYANSWFQNSDQQGKVAFDQKDYAEAVKLFDDPYKRGVALYQDGQYVAAAEAFASVNRPEISLDAQYNLGNSYFQQQEYEKAIQAYEQVLATQPDYDDAKDNLKLAKQQLQQSQDSKSDNSESNNQEQSQSDENSEQSQSDENSEQSQSEQNSEQQDSKSAQDKQADSQQNTQPQDKSSEYKPENSISTENSDNESEQAEAAAASSAMVQESDMMADALLERIKESPQQLLRGQFYIDARNSKQSPPDKPW